MPKGGWLPNYEAPEVFAGFKVTVHVPRRPYAQGLPGIPTIRVFEALACGIPLISAPWQDSESLFNGDRDFAMVANGDEMKQELKRVLDRPEEAQARARHGLQTVVDRHTCAHRVDELVMNLSGLRTREALAI
ncbi:MAG: glycosyltransferase [Fimbriimonas sp.]